MKFLVKMFIALAIILPSVGTCDAATFIHRLIQPELPSESSGLLNFKSFSLPAPSEPESLTLNGFIKRYFSYYDKPGHGTDLMNAPFVKIKRGLHSID